MRFVLGLSLLIPSAFYLAGCGDHKGCSSCPSHRAAEQEGDKGLPLITVDGKSVSTAGEFLDFVGMYIQATPQLGVFLSNLPEDQRVEALTKLAIQAGADHAIKVYVRENGLDKTKDYKDAQRRLMAQVENTLAVSAFDKHIADTITLSDEEIRKYFEDNRHQFVAKQGGVHAYGIKVKNEAAAKKVKQELEKGADVALVAKNVGAQVEDFGVVGVGSQHDPKMVRELLQVKTFPAVSIFTLPNGTMYAVKATKRVDPEFASFEAAQEHVKTQALRTKFGAARQQKMDEVLKKHTVKIDTDLLRRVLSPTQAVDAEETAGAPMSAEQDEASLAALSKAVDEAKTK
jgi:hypothetical protein